MDNNKDKKTPTNSARKKSKRVNLFLPLVISTIVMISMVITTIVIVNNTKHPAVESANGLEEFVIGENGEMIPTNSDNAAVSMNGESSVSADLAVDDTIELFDIDETVFTGEEAIDYKDFLKNN